MNPPCVLVFAGADPSGGAGIQADVQAITALGAHPLPVITVLTVQDNNRVHGIHPVDAALVLAQAKALVDTVAVAAVKIGIVGSLANAGAIAEILRALRQRQPQLPVVLDPVLASGHGDRLSQDSPAAIVSTLLPLATVVTPNLPEAAALCGDGTPEEQAARLLRDCPHVLIKGGHGTGTEVVNRWFSAAEEQAWRWPRLPGEFHGSGCTLASAIAARLAQGRAMADALSSGQDYCQQALASAYLIAPGQRMPRRGIRTENQA
ncbi:bifunctional hydroxymethylpyrimidine kinase/phosphomethylpyrimidine kinase [Noviherbaspirillum aridicola]|uniref:hydroxymethylpyrimidine kinase n=1 Tax=Noviherbaspirillum aridicola TaxID=2849687 RepID=A0ABQ4Q814_9BURK|nr:hydroxymethylpyrimidine/phosphomethylpyrimidine kinase [Noviherbaspirillum aridicola]GIZ52915.1 hydroxymethylpyrimidine/phosphomethylpyrimidine kinase [Noviherbaspirillum aridicola]